MSEVQGTKVNVGTHEFEFLTPDLLRFTLRGTMTDEDATAYLDFIHGRAAETGGLLYVAYDVSAFTRVDEQARSRITRVNRPYPFGGLVIVGANFSMRALAGMMIRAVRLFKPEYLDCPHKFVRTMAEADAWIDELREKSAK